MFLSYDVANQKFLVQIKLGNLKLVGKYKITGKILAIPLHGEGAFISNVSKYLAQKNAYN